MSATAARFPATDVRLSVEQVSYAYAANPSQAPLFTLEATSFQARPGEIVARALAQQPLLLLLDEPTLHLDIGAQVDLLEALQRLARQNRYTVVVVTHELNLAGGYSDQVVLLHRGKSLRVGPPASVYQRELLEQVFQTALTVEMGGSGRPRVSILS